jgi:menaquinone-dependent protoporphyrinogen oxidase
MNVLVAYATKHGATRGIAERIAETLSADGLATTLSPVEDAPPAEQFDAVVVGSAAYMYHWLKEASDYVRENATELTRRPTWLFTSGPIGTDLVDKDGRDVMETAKPKEFAEFEQKIHPRDLHVFFGAYDPDAPPIGLAERIGTLFIRSGVVKEALPAGDFRDWPRIEEWAHDIARQLQREPAGVGA